jgi:hypothetical protein
MLKEMPENEVPNTTSDMELSITNAGGKTVVLTGG